MKQKIILSIAILSLLSLAVLVYAQSDKQIIDNYTLSSGWNLAYGLEDPQQIISAGSNYASPPTVDEIRSSIELIYIWDNSAKEYVLLYAKRGTLETEEYKNFNPPESIAENIPTSTVWVYAERGHSIKYEAASYPSLLERTIKKGWNFVPVSEEIRTNAINDFKGNCVIESLYTYAEDDGRTQWLNLKELLPFDDTRAFGEASASELQLAIKVKDDCQMGVQ